MKIIGKEKANLRTAGDAKIGDVFVFCDAAYIRTETSFSASGLPYDFLCLDDARPCRFNNSEPVRFVDAELILR